jgi:hypothetical protein
VTPRIPHLRLVVLFCAAAIVAYAGFSIWVVLVSGDAAMIGDVIGTWKSFAVAAFSFWVGSSSGGKASTSDPQPVTVTNPPSDPVNTTETH